MMGRDGANKEVWIDDVRITGVEFNLVTESKQINFNNPTPAVSMKVYNI